MSKKEKPLSTKQLEKISKVFAKARNNFDKDISYRKFADYMGLSHSTIQAIENKNQEPSLSVINAYREKFGGTYAYWLGESQCQTLSNEEIYNMTGLSDKAINKLKEYNAIINDNDTDFFIKMEIASRLKTLNYLIENIEHEGFMPDEDMHKTCRNLLDNLHSYLFSDYDTKNRPNGNIYSEKREFKGIGKSSKGHVLQPNDVRMIYLLNIQENLIKMRDNIQLKEISKEFD